MEPRKDLTDEEWTAIERLETARRQTLSTEEKVQWVGDLAPWRPAVVVAVMESFRIEPADWMPKIGQVLARCRDVSANMHTTTENSRASQAWDARVPQYTSPDNPPPIAAPPWLKPWQEDDWWDAYRAAWREAMRPGRTQEGYMQAMEVLVELSGPETFYAPALAACLNSTARNEYFGRPALEPITWTHDGTGRLRAILSREERPNVHRRTSEV